GPRSAARAPHPSASRFSPSGGNVLTLGAVDGARVRPRSKMRPNAPEHGARGPDPEETFHADNHHQGWTRDLLQGLGSRPGRDPIAWLAAEFRRLGRPDAVPRGARFSHHRA